VSFLADAAFLGQSASALRYHTVAGTLEVGCCTSRIVRVRLLDDARTWPSYVEPRAWAAVEALQVGEPARLATADLAVEVTQPLGLTFSRPGGPALLRGRPGGALAVEQREGRRAVEIRLDPVGEQHFYGLGQGGQQFDRLGGSRQLWNSHQGHGPGSDMGIPLLVCDRGYAVFFDNTCDARVTVGRSDGGIRLVFAAEDGPLDFYVLVAADVRAVMNEVAELLGRAPMPPKWSLGYLQSTRHFEDTAELRALPRTIREKRIPCDGLIWLSTYGDALGWNREVGHLEFQPELWSDPAELVAEMREQHFELVTHEYPVLHPDSPLQSVAEERDYLLAEGYQKIVPTEHPNTNFQHGQRYIDFSRPEVRSWWWSQHRQLRDLGVAGWWLDGGEGPPATARLAGGDGTQLHNLYDRLRHQAFFEGEALDRPDQRPVLLCRSGAAGMQRYGAGTWSGDINNTFATFEYQVPWGLNTGMSGVPYWGTDVGGFFHPVPESAELYARWFQFGAFCPLFRSHGWVWREHVPWAHGEEVEAICRRYAELRYRLMPYTYALAWQTHARGLPLMRPLVLNYPDDPRVWEMGWQYLWGDDLLVAPVTREGARSWPVYLPEGSWYDFWTNERHEGGRGVAVDAPLARMPLLVRAGAIIPTGPVVQHTAERPLEEVTLLVYPGDESRFELYDDDGRTNAYRRGAYALTTIESRPEGTQVRVRVAEPRGDPTAIPAGRSYAVRLWRDGALQAPVALGRGGEVLL
jgi:alpha-glucosidase